MKKIFLGKVIFLSVLIMLIAVSGGMADQIKLYQQSDYSYGVGGEFTAKIVDSATGPDLNSNLAYYDDTTSNIGDYDPSFQTFCLEYTEYFNTNTLYNVTISDRAINGGAGAGPGGDPISVGTAWLYQQFATGALDNYNYAPDRSTSAQYLQEIIWYLESEIPLSSISGSNPFDEMLITQFGSINNAMANNNGTYSVAVLNIYGLNGCLRQDQLILVPEPSTLILLGAGLLGLGLLGRRKFKTR